MEQHVLQLPRKLQMEAPISADSHAMPNPVVIEDPYRTCVAIIHVVLSPTKTFTSLEPKRTHRNVCSLGRDEWSAMGTRVVTFDLVCFRIELLNRVGRHKTE